MCFFLVSGPLIFIKFVHCMKGNDFLVQIPFIIDIKKPAIKSKKKSKSHEILFNKMIIARLLLPSVGTGPRSFLVTRWCRGIGTHRLSSTSIEGVGAVLLLLLLLKV